MTVISDIDEFGINTNLKVRYKKDCIYVSTAFYVGNCKQKAWIGIFFRCCFYIVEPKLSFSLQTYSGTILVAVNPYHQLNIYEMVNLTYTHMHKNY